MLADLENDSHRQSFASALAAYIGCDEVLWQMFDHGAEIGMLARWGEVQHADRQRVTGERPHPSNALLENAGNPWFPDRFALLPDFYAAADKLKAWHAGRP